MIIRLALASLCLSGAVVHPMAASAQSRPEERSGRDAGPEAGSANPPSVSSSSVSSLRHIREALGRPPGRLHEALTKNPTFRVEIRGRVPLEELIGDVYLTTGPQIPGGLHNYEQQLAVFPSPDAPGRTQAGGMDLLAIGRSVANTISNARHARASSAAREEVRRAIAEYCAQQPSGGADIRICAPLLK